MPAQATAREPATDRLSRLAPWVLLAITALGVYLRGRTLGADTLWLDEAYTLTLSGRSFADMWLRPIDTNPPLYYVLHKLVLGSSQSLEAMRAISLVAGGAAIPLIYLLGRSVGGVVTGLAAALFLAVSGPQIEYSQEARTYAVLFLVVLGSATALAETLRRTASGEPGTGRYHAIYAALALLAAYFHFSGLFWMAAGHLILLLRLLAGPERRRQAVRLAASSIWLFVAVLPLLAMMSGNVGQWKVAGTMTAGRAMKILHDLVLVRVESEWSAVAVAVLAGALALGVVAVLRSRLALQVVGAFVLFLLVMGVVSTIQPAMMFRTSLLFLVAPILCWAAAVAWLPRAGGTVLAGAVAASLLTAHLAYERQGSDRYDWDEAAAFLEASAKPGDVVVLCKFWTWQPLRYYLSDDFGVPIAGHHAADVAALWPAPRDEERPWVESYPPGQDAAVGTADLRSAREPGSVAWIVDSHCFGERRKIFDAFLARLGSDPEPVWKGRGVSIEAMRF